MTDEVKETEEIQEETEEIKPEEETKESVIDKIGEKVKNFFSGPQEEEENVDVPQEFYDVASSQGWSDDEIMDFILDEGKRIYSDEELVEMIPVLKGENPTEVEEISDNPEEDETKDKQGEDSQDDEKQKLLARIEALEKAQEKSLEKNKKQEVSQLVTRAAQIFDEASKEFEIFGTTEKLPTFPDGRLVPNSPQLKARSEVWEIGMKLHGAGLDFDSAMSTAINAYKGKNLSKVIERNVIKDLKKREKKLSGKRVRHETIKSIDYGPDVVEEMLKKHGRV